MIHVTFTDNEYCSAHLYFKNYTTTTVRHWTTLLRIFMTVTKLSFHNRSRFSKLTVFHSHPQCSNLYAAVAPFQRMCQTRSNCIIAMAEDCGVSGSWVKQVFCSVLFCCSLVKPVHSARSVSWSRRALHQSEKYCSFSRNVSRPVLFPHLGFKCRRELLMAHRCRQCSKWCITSI